MAKKIFSAVLSVVLMIAGGYFLFNGLSDTMGSKNKTNTSESKSAPTNPTLLLPGEVFNENTYIEVSNVLISYNGENFFVQSNRTDSIRITCSVVGMKNDGTYDILQVIGFYGADEVQYDKDLQENGWASKKNTNLVRAGETLKFELDTNTFVRFDSNNEPLERDVDNDGYWDIQFTISPQLDEDQIITSTDDPKSEVYKINER